MRSPPFPLQFHDTCRTVDSLRVVAVRLSRTTIPFLARRPICPSCFCSPPHALPTAALCRSEEFALFWRLGLDAVFTDFSDHAKRARNLWLCAQRAQQDNSAVPLLLQLMSTPHTAMLPGSSEVLRPLTRTQTEERPYKIWRIHGVAMKQRVAMAAAFSARRRGMG